MLMTYKSDPAPVATISEAREGVFAIVVNAEPGSVLPNKSTVSYALSNASQFTC